MILSAQNITMRFGGLTAIKNANLAVKTGSITGLIGPNGAGKTTLFSVVSGFLQPNEGKVLFLDQDITKIEPHLRTNLGMARTFQIVQPFQGLSILENIMVGSYLHHAERNQAEADAKQIAAQVGLSPHLEKQASDLTVAGRKRLELARALATKPKLLLLDEVLAGLNPSEIRDIIPVIQKIRADGITILMIEHVMQAIVSLCDDVYVLAQGEIIAHGSPKQVMSSPLVIEAYLGHGAAARINATQEANNA